MLELRDYQREAVDRVWNQLEAGSRPIVCAPTGSGKTVIAAQLARDAIDRGLRVIFMSGRREILTQAYSTISGFCGMYNVRFLMAGEPGWRFYPQVTVASWDTLKARWDRSDVWHVPADLVLIDECHLALSEKMSETVLPFYKDRQVVGFTATPARKTGLGLGDYFTSIIQVRSVQQLIQDGHLAPCEYWGGSRPDVSRVRCSHGDFNEKALAEKANTNMLVGDVIDNWLRLAAGLHTIVFAVDIAHAQALAERFRGVGVNAECVHSKLELEERTDITQRFRKGEIQVLINVQIATYGYDVPSVRCVVLARPTESIVLHLQMIGRGMRPKPDGECCRVLDHAGNVQHHGFAADDRRWSLDRGKDAATNRSRDLSVADSDETKLIECQECHYMFDGTRVCPQCGWELPVIPGDVDTTDDLLVRIGEQSSGLPIEPTEDELDPIRFYEECLGYARDRGFKEGHAKHSFYDKFGHWPPLGNAYAPRKPSPRVLNYLLSRQIRYSKQRRQRQQSTSQHS